MDKDRIDLERLDRFVRGEGTPAEQAAHTRWVDADLARYAIARAMRTIGSTNGQSPPPFDAAQALRRVEAKLAIGSGTRTMRFRFPASPRRPLFGRWPLLAGLAVAAVIVGIVALKRGETQSPSKAALWAPDIVTGPGQRALLDLGDGTHVVLSAESHLRIPADFGGARTRELWIEGEAFFAVRHDATRPFVVHTPHGSIEDLGTEFVVNSYPETNGMRLAVREGRVAVRARRDSTSRASAMRRSGVDTLAVLEPGDVALLGRSGALDVARRQNVALLFAATEGSLVFSRTPLRDAIPRLERWYGIQVRVRNRSLLSRTITGTFRDETSTEALGVVAIALGSKPKWHQNQVTLVSDHGSGENQ